MLDDALDEELGAAVSPPAHLGILADGRVLADRREFIRRDLGQALRPSQPSSANGAANNHFVWLVRDANPESALFGGIELGRDFRIAGILLFAGKVGKIA